ncbi:conserved hypothetical protein [delta proteobacterium NaphS2]|nr:conserved hypothetical protein [delta proteobacterium NaphS2]
MGIAPQPNESKVIVSDQPACFQKSTTMEKCRRTCLLHVP